MLSHAHNNFNTNKQNMTENIVEIDGAKSSAIEYHLQTCRKKEEEKKTVI